MVDEASTAMMERAEGWEYRRPPWHPWLQVVIARSPVVLALVWIAMVSMMQCSPMMLVQLRSQVVLNPVC